MRYLRLALLPLVFAACTETQAPLDVTPQFDWSNAPPNSGIVFRGTFGLGIWFTDADAGVGAIQGGDVVEFCLTGGTTFPLVEFQDVVSPSDEGRILEVFKGGVNTTVWPFTVFDCSLFTTVTPLASGPVRIVGTDNDVLSFLYDRANANAYGWVATGTLTRSSGGMAHYNAVNRIVYSPTAGWAHVTQKINFK